MFMITYFVVTLSPAPTFFSAISFNIYGVKSNESHFFFETVTVHFWDKPSQEINFQSH